MTQTRRPNRQLELPMLSDINGKSGVVQKLVGSTDVGLNKPTSAPVPGATEKDLSVYEQISASYFHSLKKA